MRLIEVVIQNFKQIRKPQSLNLANRGLIGIFGRNRDDPSLVTNGAGKTTIPDAILWCLTGFTTSGDSGPQAAKGDEVVNEKARKDCCVTLRVEDDAGEVWTVTRYRRHGKHRNRLTLSNTKGDHTQHLNDDTQERVTRLLGGLDYEALMTAMVFGQGVTRPFSLLSPKEQEEVLDTISGVNLVRRMLAVIRERKARVRSDLSEAERDFERAHAAIADLELEIKELRREQQRAEKARTKERKRLAAEVREARKRLSDAERANVQRDVLRDAVDVARKVLNERTKKYEAAVARYNLREHELEVARAAVVDLRLKRKARGGTCRECGSTITADTIPKLLEKARTKAIALERGLKIQQKARRITGEDKREAEKALETARIKLEKLPGLQMREAERLYKEAQRRYKRFHEQKDTHQQLIDKHVAKVRLLQREKRVAVKLRKELRERLAHLDWCEKQCNTNIPLDIHESVVPFLNEAAAEVSAILTDGAVSVTFATEKQNKNGTVRDGLSIQSPNTYGSALYKLQSRAERQRIDIIIAAAFQALGTQMSKANLNVRFFDEPFDGLDAEATDRVVTFLRREQERVESVFVITHSEHLRPVFESNHFTMLKVNGATTIEE